MIEFMIEKRQPIEWQIYYRRWKRRDNSQTVALLVIYVSLLCWFFNVRAWF